MIYAVPNVGNLRWQILALLFFATTINYIDRQIIGILKPFIAKDLHWGEADYGYIVTAFQIAYALGLILTGRFLDTVGTRLGYLWAVLVWSLAGMAHAAATGVFSFAAARFALGFGEAANFPAAVKSVAEWFPRKERALAAGLFNSGSTVGPILAPLIVSGFGIAEQLIAQHARVVITGRTKDRLDEARHKLGENCIALVNDVTEKDAHKALIDHIETTIGPIAILVNNAGIHCKKPSIETTDAEFQAVMDTNVLSVFALTREVLTYMMPRGQGSVINISSMSALFGLTQVVAYSSSKTALLGMTRTLASEYSHTGVRFNAVAPGFIESAMFLTVMEKDPARKAKILSRTPAGRFGQPADIGRAVAFLASDAAAFITGVCLPVDCGNSIGF